MPTKTPPEVPHLTAMETEILRRIALSQSSQRIALELNIQYDTVMWHRRNLIKKVSYVRNGMCNNNTAALTRFAIGQGLIEVEPEWKK